eukprot:gnl/TRDRNA2_/TRDRNA2_46494_c0_seq1.p1 gnl/TRDRNA2_/TRDRNA2_46494_c0~~gnl/TRDRNA2_/TRDRNA2_46494_c0_seq1.p1  ORF type:complete len:256 (-),score=42.91 gnl/TRDRNA2_/TRDRNA2_46494_c0_seq1:93-794(-)
MVSLAAKAWQCYQDQGRGALFADYDTKKTLAGGKQEQHWVKEEYIPLSIFETGQRENASATETDDPFVKIARQVKEYDPQTSFVFLCSIDGMVSGAVITPKTPPQKAAQRSLRDSRIEGRTMDKLPTSAPLPQEVATTPVPTPRAEAVPTPEPGIRVKRRPPPGKHVDAVEVDSSMPLPAGVSLIAMEQTRIQGKHLIACVLCSALLLLLVGASEFHASQSTASRSLIPLMPR